MLTKEQYLYVWTDGFKETLGPFADMLVETEPSVF